MAYIEITCNIDLQIARDDDRLQFQKYDKFFREGNFYTSRPR